MTHDLRRWITLCEAVAPTGSYYLHVSSGKNLQSILKNGLRQEGDGNYSGYETALSGVYVTKEPTLIQSHINARMMESDYVLVIVMVGSTGVIDEDALDGWLRDALEAVAKKQGMSVDDLMEEDPETVGKAMARPFRASLGNSIKNPGRDLSEFLAEFCQTWFDERFVGGESGADGDWWMAAKERVLKTFPKLGHSVFGTDYSLRLPGPIGFSGETHIVAVIHVQNENTTIVAGTVPRQAQALVGDLVPMDEPNSEPNTTDPETLVQLAVERHPERSRAEIEAKVKTLDARTISELIRNYRAKEPMVA